MHDCSDALVKIKLAFRYAKKREKQKKSRQESFPAFPLSRPSTCTRLATALLVRLCLRGPLMARWGCRPCKCTHAFEATVADTRASCNVSSLTKMLKSFIILFPALPSLHIAVLSLPVPTSARRMLLMLPTRAVAAVHPTRPYPPLPPHHTVSLCPKPFLHSFLTLLFLHARPLARQLFFFSLPLPFFAFLVIC